jgi:hypothetical protein
MHKAWKIFLHSVMAESRVEKVARVNQLQTKILTIKQDIADAENKILALYKRKGDIILEWAECLEELYELGIYTKPVSTICQTIVGELQAMGLHLAIRNAYRVLPDKYKDAVKVNAASANDYSGLGPDPFDFSIPSTPLAPVQSAEEWASLSSDEKQQDTERAVDQWHRLEDLAREARKRADIKVKRCEAEGIPLAVTEQETSKPESTEKPDPAETDLSKAIDHLIQVFESVGEKVIEFPPANKQDARRYAKAVYDFASIFEPICDEKYSKSWPDWWKIQYDNIKHGKHAAATMNYSISHKGEKRPLTREQVGDRFEVAYQKLVDFEAAVPIVFELADYYRKWQEPRRADRKIRVAPKLSEKA